MFGFDTGADIEYQQTGPLRRVDNQFPALIVRLDQFVKPVIQGMFRGLFDQ